MITVRPWTRGPAWLSDSDTDGRSRFEDIRDFALTWQDGVVAMAEGATDGASEGKQKV